jgi:hypothetical protein
MKVLDKVMVMASLMIAGACLVAFIQSLVTGATWRAVSNAMLVTANAINGWLWMNNLTRRGYK